MPLVEMEQESFALPVMNAIATHFLTATAAARHMRKNGSGVILAITASAVMGYPNVGGFGVACAAIDGFCRHLAAEAGRPGIRVFTLRAAPTSRCPARCHGSIPP